MSMAPVVHIELRMSPRMFEKIRNGLMGDSTDIWKNLKSKISWQFPF